MDGGREKLQRDRAARRHRAPRGAVVVGRRRCVCRV